MAFPNAPILDNFNRAAEGPPPSASWVTSSGTGLQVASNQVRGNAAAASDGATWNTSFAADQESYCTIATPPSAAAGESVVACVRLATNTDILSNHYEVDATVVAGAANDVLQVWKRSAGVYTQLGADIALSADLTAGDVSGCRAESSTITAFYNGASRGTRTDTDVTAAGFAGLAVFETAAANARVDDFGGGSTESSDLMMARHYLGVP